MSRNYMKSFFVIAFFSLVTTTAQATKIMSVIGQVAKVAKAVSPIVGTADTLKTIYDGVALVRSKFKNIHDGWERIWGSDIPNYLQRAMILMSRSKDEIISAISNIPGELPQTKGYINKYLDVSMDQLWEHQNKNSEKTKNASMFQRLQFLGEIVMHQQMMNYVVQEMKKNNTCFAYDDLQCLSFLQDLEKFFLNTICKCDNRVLVEYGRTCTFGQINLIAINPLDVGRVFPILRKVNQIYNDYIKEFVADITNVILYKGHISDNSSLLSQINRPHSPISYIRYLQDIYLTKLNGFGLIEERLISGDVLCFDCLRGLDMSSISPGDDALLKIGKHIRFDMTTIDMFTAIKCLQDIRICFSNFLSQNEKKAYELATPERFQEYFGRNWGDSTQFIIILASGRRLPLYEVVDDSYKFFSPLDEILQSKLTFLNGRNYDIQNTLIDVNLLSSVRIGDLVNGFYDDYQRIFQMLQGLTCFSLSRGQIDKGSLNQLDRANQEAIRAGEQVGNYDFLNIGNTETGTEAALTARSCIIDIQLKTYSRLMSLIRKANSSFNQGDFDLWGPVPARSNDIQTLLYHLNLK